MKKLNLIEWAAVGEITASVAVIISLVFLIVSVNRNSEITRATNDNLLYELQDALYGDLSRDLAAIRVKLHSNEDLTAIEAERYQYFLWRWVNIWSLAFERHLEGLLADDKWQEWNKAFEIIITQSVTGMPKDWWEDGKPTFGVDFAKHVDAAYSNH